MKRIICLLLATFLLFSTAWAEENKEYRIPVTNGDLSVCQGLDPDWINILLIGADSLVDTMNEGRADALIVCSINQTTGQLRLLSVERDMWVNIPTTSFYDRINTGFRYGGPDLMMKTINETLQLNITQYVAINFYGFCDVIDLLDGVEIELTSAEANYINRVVDEKYGEASPEHLSAQDGLASLCGVQALTYARIRHLDNDFARTQRHRTLLFAILDKVQELSFLEQMGFVRNCMEQVTTNLSLSDIITLGTIVLSNGLEDIDQMAVPTKGNYHHDSADGRSKVIFDMEETRSEAHAFIYGE